MIEAKAALSGQSPQDVADSDAGGLRKFDPSYRPPQVHPRLLGRPTGMPPPTGRFATKNQASRAFASATGGAASGDLKRKAIKRAVGIYADAEEKRQVI